MLECNKNYVILVLNYALKNLKGTLSVSEINDVETIISKTTRIHKTLKKALMNIKE